MEIGPGRYNKKHWQPGFLFIWEDAFGMAEGIVTKHFPSYDHFGMNDISKKIGKEIITEWRTAASRIIDNPEADASTLLNLSASYSTSFAKEIGTHRQDIADLLARLADACEKFYRQKDCICILGM